jgi:hypothetical protein
MNLKGRRCAKNGFRARSPATFVMLSVTAGFEIHNSSRNQNERGRPAFTAATPSAERNIRMSYVSKPKPKGKGHINKTRDACRRLVRECANPELTGDRKCVLYRVIDYLNSETGVAWPSFDTLAADTGLSRRTVIRAINVARKAGVLKRIWKGGKARRGGVSNSYAFNLHPVPDLVSGVSLGGEADLVSGVTQPSVRRDPNLVSGVTPYLLNRSSNDLGDDAAAASAVTAVVGSVAASFTSSDDRFSEQAASAAKRLSEEEREPRAETAPTSSAPEAPSSNPEDKPMPKQTLSARSEEFRAEMRARGGLDMSASRWSRGRKHGHAGSAAMPVIPAKPEPAANPTDSEAPKVWSTPTVTEIPWTEYWAREYERLKMEEVTEAA